jgi:hypothetical protein
VNIGAFFRTAQKAAIDNAPAILTGIAVVGTISSIAFTGKATFKAADVIAKKQAELDAEEESHPLTGREKVELTWRYYVPAAGTAVLTIACIIGANRISTTRAAALASAYTAVQKGFKEYQNKVVEQIGKNKEQKVRDSIAQDRIDKKPPSAEVTIVGTGSVLCMDAYSGRYFNGDMEALRSAENDINYQIIHQDYASLSDLYSLIGLESTSESDNLGWNTDTKFEIEYSTALAPDGRPCISIDFRTIPIHGFFSSHGR